MGMFDTLNQAKANPAAMGAAVGGANGGSFAQKQMLQKNPIMKGRPATQGAPMGAPAGVGQGVPVQKPANPFGAAPGMTPNAMGARPALQQPQVPGMMGSRNQIMQKQLAAKQAAQQKPIGGTLGGSPQNYNPMGSTDMVAPPPQAPSGLQTMQLPNLAPPQSNGAMSGQLNPAAQTPPEYDMGAVASPGLVNAPFGGEQPGSPSFQAMVEQLGQSRPDMMRGLGPSGGGLAEMSPMQEMGQPMGYPQQPVQMDENGLEPRRGAR